MGLKIIKPTYEMGSKVVTAPVVTRFFHQTLEEKQAGDTIKVDVSDFLDDTGETPDELPELNMSNSYFNVYINGMLQMEDNFAYTAGEAGIGNLLITLPEESHIASGTPIILEVINYEPVVE
ncbi:hypothetical protein J416_09921 [Gracilibacillus halophilus YIM-C55.5]|uniref:DUF4183 domain-containing protein n=1 Tax=Gracilibacillus halophilus YIM-C55.5 TaxID=1308866 RepID=N4WKE2_9BACI|nr:DUF4183 domain-containing protein [Gracilibacillus halophilus]ENH96612.1 hypothetical protein J416_09921 [Gracilibacillus halophilus YIM-C55.5]